MFYPSRGDFLRGYRAGIEAAADKLDEIARIKYLVTQPEWDALRSAELEIRGLPDQEGTINENIPKS
jgi:hypothetical protein